MIDPIAWTRALSADFDVFHHIIQYWSGHRHQLLRSEYTSGIIRDALSEGFGECAAVLGRLYTRCLGECGSTTNRIHQDSFLLIDAFCLSPDPINRFKNR